MNDVLQQSSMPGDAVAGWQGKDLRKEDCVLDVPAEVAEAIERLTDQLLAQGKARAEIVLQDMQHDAAVARFMAEVGRRLAQPSGLIVIRGLPVGKYTVKQLEIMYWALSLHIGNPLSQSSAGDTIGYVMDIAAVTGKKNSRGYLGNRALSMHSDSAEVLGLFCMRRSKEGGENVISSSLAVFDIVRRERPDLAAVLEQGFYYHRKGEEAPGQAGITPYRVPVSSEKNGRRSCRYAREIIEVAAREPGYALTPIEIEALDYFDEVATRPDVSFELQLEDGELLYLNNYELLHARQPFVDWGDPEKNRLLLRIWLEGRPPRDMAKEVQVYENIHGRQGIDPQEGREPGDEAFTAVNH